MCILDTSKAIKRFQSMKSSQTLSFKTSDDLRLKQLLENVQKLHITQAEKVDPNSSLYSNTKKKLNCNTESAFKSRLIELLTQSKDFKLVITLALVYKKERN